jgi:inner membrane protein
MHKEGHMGVSLLLGSPVALVLLLEGYITSGFSYIFVVMMLSSYPDIDLNTDGLSHRGFTHTVWFGLLVGSILSFISLLIVIQETIINYYLDPSLFPLVMLGAGLTGIIFHTAGDIVTPAGVQIMPPFIDEIGFGFFRANNKIANVGLLTMGFISLVSCLMIFSYGIDSVFRSVLIFVYVVGVPVVVTIASVIPLSYNRTNIDWIKWFNLRNILH